MDENTEPAIKPPKGRPRKDAPPRDPPPPRPRKKPAPKPTVKRSYPRRPIKQEPTARQLAHIIWTEDRAKRSPIVTFKDGVPYIGNKQVIYTDKQLEVVQREFKVLPTAMGYLRFFSILEQKYEGIRRKTVQTFLRQEPNSQLYRRRNRVSTVVLPAAKRPLHRWQADFGGFGDQGHYTYRGVSYRSFLVIVDGFTKLTFIGPVRTESTEEALRVVKEWLAWLDSLQPNASSRVKVLQTDQGSAFNDAFGEYLQDRNIKHIHGAPYTSWSQGQAERMVQSVKLMLRSTAETKSPNSKKVAWPKFVDEVMNALNNGWSRTINMTPVQALTASETDIKERLDATRSTRRATNVYEKRALKVGDKVRISMRIVGSAKIKAAIKNGTFKSSNRQWGNEIHEVDARWGSIYYYLKDAAGRYNRSDLLKIDPDTPDTLDDIPQPDPEPDPDGNEPAPKRRRKFKE
jgi:transposase InsO family protein